MVNLRSNNDIDLALHNKTVKGNTNFEGLDELNGNQSQKNFKTTDTQKNTPYL